MRDVWRRNDVWTGRLAALAAPVLAAVGVVLLGDLGSRELFASPGWAPLGEWAAWLGGVSPERAVAVVARLVAIGFGYYALGSFVVYAVAVALRVPGLVRAVEWGTLPVVRRMAHRLVAVSLTASAAVAGPGAGVVAAAVEVPVPTPGAVVVVEQSSPTGEADESEAAEPGIEPPLQMAEIVGVPAQAVEVPPHAPQFPADEFQAAPVLADRYVVEPGDHLWGIAAERMAEFQSVGAGEAPDPVVAAYWVRVLEANRDRLRSGDPNLIFPGEVIVVPDLEGS